MHPCRCRPGPVPGSYLLLLRLGFRYGLHGGQALLELAPEGLVHVDEQENGSAHEVVVAEHAPRHGGAIAVRLERELRRVGRREGLQELELDPDQLVGTAVRDRHAPLADLVVAGPRERGALAGRRALVRVLHLGVELRPRRPRFPLVEVVDLREHRRRRRSDRRRALDTELGRARGDDQGQHADDQDDRGDDASDHLAKHGDYRAPSRADDWDDERIGTTFQRPYATNARSNSTTNGATAAATPPIIRLITVAPIMMTIKPTAATGASAGRIRRRLGRIRPKLPTISQTPMNLKNGPGSWICWVISSTDMTNFITPANRNRSASSPCTIHSAYLMVAFLRECSIRRCAGSRYCGGPSRTGRTSMVPTRASGPRAAKAIASSRLSTSMSIYPPSCSRVSANGSSVKRRLPSRTRTLVAVDTGCSGLPPRYRPCDASSSDAFTWPQ